MANRSVSALLLSGATASANGNDMDNFACRSAVVTIDITAISASTAVFTVQGKDEISGKYYTILASSALNATGTTVLRIDPSLTASANLIAADIMPKFWRVIFTSGGAQSVTATVGVALVG